MIYEFSIIADMLNEIDVKAIRRDLNMTQVEFAKALGVSQSIVSGWETKGPPKRGAARKLLLSFAVYGKALAETGRAA